MKDKILHLLNRFGLVLLGLFIGFYCLTCAYYLPRTIKVHITGTEVKRNEANLKDGSTKSSDVRYVQTKTLDGHVKVFQNRDTGWGWPPYFKFNAGDLAGEAQGIANGQKDAIVLIKYYGWRLHVMHLYPNVVSMKVIPEGYESIPIFNIVFGVVSLIAFIMIWIGFRRLKKWRPFHKEAADAEDPADVAEAAADDESAA